MTEPAADGGADPSMMKAAARREGNQWVINGRKAFITGADGAAVGLVMAMTENGATTLLIDLPAEGVWTERVLEHDRQLYAAPSRHGGLVRLACFALPSAGDGGGRVQNRQLRLAPARLTHCMRWHGGGARARSQEIATDYACRPEAFGKTLIEHGGAGFMLADNMFDLQPAALLID